MKGLQEHFIHDIYRLSDMNKSWGLRFAVNFFEIYGGKCYDLFNNREPLTILEDKNNNVYSGLGQYQGEQKRKKK